VMSNSMVSKVVGQASAAITTVQTKTAPFVTQYHLNEFAMEEYVMIALTVLPAMFLLIAITRKMLSLCFGGGGEETKSSPLPPAAPPVKTKVAPAAAPSKPPKKEEVDVRKSVAMRSHTTPVASKGTANPGAAGSCAHPSRGVSVKSSAAKSHSGKGKLSA